MMTEPFDDKMIDELVHSSSLDRLLDSIKPMCEVGRTEGKDPAKACPAEAVFLLGFRCTLHGGDKVTRVMFCTGHRNLLNNIIDRFNSSGHPHEIVFEELISASK